MFGKGNVAQRNLLESFVFTVVGDSDRSAKSQAHRCPWLTCEHDLRIRTDSEMNEVSMAVVFRISIIS